MRPNIPTAVLLNVCLAAGAWGAELVGPGKIFIRFTNTRPDTASILIRLNVVPNHHQPFSWTGKTVYVGKDGDSENAETSRHLAPGQSSPWVDVGRYMNRRGTRSWDTYLSPLLCGVLTNPRSDGLFVIAEVAQGPGTRVVRRIQIAKPDLAAETTKRRYPWHLGYSVWNGSGPIVPTLGLLVPAQPDICPRVYTLEEALLSQLDVIEEFPDRGRVPTRFVFKTRGRPEILEALGYRGYPPGTVEGNLGDEISIKLSLSRNEQNERFRHNLKERGFDPLELIENAKLAQARTLPRAEQWALVTIEPLPERPKQYYESANFRYKLWYETLAAKTRKTEAAHPGKRVLVGANFSPHMNVWPDVRQWIGPFKARAMTMTWTEDWWWQLPEISPQVYGFLLDGLRLAGSYHGAPLQYYVMPFKGNSPDNFRRMNVLGLAHGAKILNHFHTEAQVLTTWDYVDVIESPRTYQAIHDVVRDVGAVEQRLYPALPRKAKIAILLSRAADTWDTEDLGGAGHLYSAKYNVNNDERKAIWLALRHAQYPVDLITDEDIAEGRLAGYRVLYVVGAEMLAAAAKPLREWVAAGGIVFAAAGGGLLDEYHRPQTALHDLYGIKDHDLVRQVRHIRPRRDLPRAQPLDTVSITPVPGRLDALTLPALLYRETLTPAAAARVAGTFAKDSRPAAILNNHGRGLTLYVGVLAGIAYLTPAFTPSSETLPAAFPAELRSFITAPARWAGVVSPVVTSEPLVEAQYMEGKNGAIVALLNWREQPIETLTVRFPGAGTVRSVKSLRAAGFFKGSLEDAETGNLAVATEDGVPQVKLRLAVTDFLLVN